MRRSLCCSLPRWTLTLGGLAIAAVAVAAYPLGLDENPDMGPRRAALLALGLGAILFAQAGAIRKKLGIAVPSGPPGVFGQDLEPESPAAPPQRMGMRSWLPLSLISLGTLASYAWFVTAGDPASPPPTTLYYDMLAEAFASGQTHLKIVPDPRLAALRNPYDPAELDHIPRCPQGQTSGCRLFDATYYDGKYFLYWGPAPAALLTPLKLAGVGAVSDSALAFIGAISLFAFTAAFFVLLWRRFFRSLPGWLLVPPLILAGLAYPRPWVLDAPRIYEAAILHGAAFLMAGLVAAFPILSGGRGSRGRLVLVGILWGLAFATRSVSILPIVALCAALCWLVLKRRGSSGPSSGGWLVASLVVPIVASIALIASYNFDRFSNPLEFGWRYIAGFPSLAEGTLGAFHVASIPTNLYNYAFAPAFIIEDPPYLRPALATRLIGPIAIPSSGAFYGELVTGILFTTPFLIFAFSLLWWLTSSPYLGSQGIARAGGLRRGDDDNLRVAATVVVLGFIAGLVPLLTNYAVVTRYLLDVSPLLIVLSGTGAWIAYAGTTTRTTRALVGLAIVGTALASAVASVLLALNNWLR